MRSSVGANCKGFVMCAGVLVSGNLLGSSLQSDIVKGPSFTQEQEDASTCPKSLGLDVDPLVLAKGEYPQACPLQVYPTRFHT